MQGTKLAALVRELTSGERKGQYKVSLRATDDDVDVSAIARAQGGGGHRRAAGFSTTLELDELIAFLRSALAAQLHAVLRRAARAGVRTPAPSASRHAPDGVLLIDKPAGITSHDVVAAVRRALDGAKTGHAGTLDPFATGLLIVLVGRATKAQRQMMELRKRYETVAQLGAVSSTGDTEGEVTADRAPAAAIRRSCRRARSDSARRAYSAVKIGGERAYKRARRGEQFEMPERIVTVYRFEQLWRERDRRSGAADDPPRNARQWQRWNGRAMRSNARRAPTCAR